MSQQTAPQPPVVDLALGLSEEQTRLALSTIKHIHTESQGKKLSAQYQSGLRETLQRAQRELSKLTGINDPKTKRYKELMAVKEGAEWIFHEHFPDQVAPTAAPLDGPKCQTCRDRHEKCEGTQKGCAKKGGQNRRMPSLLSTGAVSSPQKKRTPKEKGATPPQPRIKRCQNCKDKQIKCEGLRGCDRVAPPKLTSGMSTS